MSDETTGGFADGVHLEWCGQICRLQRTMVFFVISELIRPVFVSMLSANFLI
jgi:hypothetical protein